MNYKVDITGFEGRVFEVQGPGLLSGAKLLIDGQPAPKGKKMGQMLLTRADGTEVVAKWKPKLLGLDVPDLLVGDQTIQVTEPLPWHQWGFSALPMVLVFIGGALGGLFGAVAAVGSIKVFRSSLTDPLKYVASLALMSLCTLLYFISAVALSLILA